MILSAAVVLLGTWLSNQQAPAATTEVRVARG
jgi:hypothetical protein